MFLLAPGKLVFSESEALFTRTKDNSIAYFNANMLSELETMDEKFEDWENEDLNDAELKHYLEVSARISSKMLEFAGQIA